MFSVCIDGDFWSSVKDIKKRELLVLPKVDHITQGSNCRGPTAKRGPIWSLNDSFSGAEGAEIWERLGKFGLSDAFLKPQTPKILRNFGILVKN